MGLRMLGPHSVSLNVRTQTSRTMPARTKCSMHWDFDHDTWQYAPERDRNGREKGQRAQSKTETTFHNLSVIYHHFNSSFLLLPMKEITLMVWEPKKR